MESKKSAIVILGASGDLARRKLIPALLRLCQSGQLEQSSVIIGSGRSALTDEGFRTLFDVPDRFATRLFYHQGIAGLKKYLADKGDFSRIIVFFALPPHVYSDTARELAREGFGAETSIIVEKPFGSDYSSAVAINKELGRYFSESNIYRNDHYLAKEAVQNILVFRFSNYLFYPVWNNHYIESIQINAFEKQGVEMRSQYFDRAGILRDMVQNHLMQLVCLMTMEAPISLSANDISDKKIEILRSINIDECYRYQYDGYRLEQGVDTQSETETYAEIKLHINNLKWAGVPIYIRCGKALDRDGTEIGVRFKRMPIDFFKKQGSNAQNAIVFLIQPQAGIILGISSKGRSADSPLKNAKITFCYNDSSIPEAYQQLLIDAIRGDHTLFVRAQEAELAWKLLDGFLDKGILGHYKGKTLPASHFDIEWIDFENFKGNCRI